MTVRIVPKIHPLPTVTSNVAPDLRRFLDRVKENFDDEVIISEYEAMSSNDLLSCHNCEQTLRVALDKRPVRSRCPACRVEFIAKIG